MIVRLKDIFKKPRVEGLDDVFYTGGIVEITPRVQELTDLKSIASGSIMVRCKSRMPDGTFYEFEVMMQFEEIDKIYEARIRADINPIETT